MLTERAVRVNLHDTETEARVLSAIINSEQALLETIGVLQEEDFQHTVNKNLFLAATSLYERGIRPTYIELAKELRHSGIITLEQLKQISGSFVADGNLAYWLKRLKDLSKLRKLAAAMRVVADKLRAQEVDAEAVLLEAEEAIYKLNAEDTSDAVDTPDELATAGAAEVERRYANKGKLDGLHTGFTELDRITNGYKPGDLVLIGGRTGHGKTALALNIARRIAVVDKQPLLYINTEMSKQQILLRWGAILSGVEHDRIRSGFMAEDELIKVQQSYAQLHDSEFYSYYCPNLSPGKLLSVSRKFHIQKKVKCIIVDYVGRMDKLHPDLKEWQVLEQIVKNMKLLAQTLGIVVIGLVQLNEDERLQGARRMENEADVFMKFKPMEADELLENQGRNYWIYVQKNRDGESGVMVPVLFNKRNQVISGG